MLAIDAARFGAPHLRDGISALPPPSRWRPRWATGGQISTALQASLTGHTGRVEAVACTMLDGRPVAVTGGATARCGSGTSAPAPPSATPSPATPTRVAAVACTTLDDRPVAVTAGGDGTVRIWDLSTRTAIGDPLTGHTSGVTAVACTTSTAARSRSPAATTARCGSGTSAPAPPSATPSPATPAA